MRLLEKKNYPKTALCRPYDLLLHRPLNSNLERAEIVTIIIGRFLQKKKKNCSLILNSLILALFYCVGHRAGQRTLTCGDL